MVPGSARNWIAVNAVQQFSFNKKQNMTTLHLKKSMGRSPSRLGVLLIPVVFACFALSPSAQAVGPEPTEGDLIGNMAEEDDAVADLGGDMVEAATGQAANTPNKRVINFNFKKPLQCAGGDVILRGNVLITFKHISPGKVVPTSLKLEGFTGTAKSGNRKLVAKNLKLGGGFGGSKVAHNNGRGDGQFDFEFIVTGPPLPGGRPLRIRVFYQMNKYIFHEGEVKKLTPDNRPVVRCNP
jgi:hypothetical protein